MKRNIREHNSDGISSEVLTAIENMGVIAAKYKEGEPVTFPGDVVILGSLKTKNGIEVDMSGHEYAQAISLRGGTKEDPYISFRKPDGKRYWYTKGPSPGGPGCILIDGYYPTDIGDGHFAVLPNGDYKNRCGTGDSSEKRLQCISAGMNFIYVFPGHKAEIFYETKGKDLKGKTKTFYSTGKWVDLDSQGVKNKTYGVRVSYAFDHIM